MISTKGKRTKIRKPNRDQNAARVSIAWDVYDRLDAIGAEESASLSEVIRGLLDHAEHNP